jgi:tetratricopeptide (TPR) repeat protein
MRGNERETLLAFARGEATWAEVEGITATDAARIARTGVELAQAGRLREAALVFEAMVEINPRDAGAHAALGTVYQKLGRTEDALAAYGQALARDAAHPVALGNRGELLLRPRSSRRLRRRRRGRGGGSRRQDRGRTPRGAPGQGDHRRRSRSPRHPVR